MRSISRQELSFHDSLHVGIWVLYRGFVYDVTEFALDHPGGVDIIIHYGGKDISDLMGDASIHDHSPMAYQILDKYKIGILEEEGLDNTSDQMKKNDLLMKKDLKKAQVTPDDGFIDLDQPLVWQVFLPRKKMTKKYYLEQVHCPRYLPHPARFFGNPILEVLTRTPWWLIAVLWIPSFLYLVFKSLELFPWWKVSVFVAQGLFLWSVIEYVVHRFLFHLDSLLPDNQFFFGLHFLLHGVHHFLPMDR
jgi:4-hydroxysphinganine ceramide fatty acyl 2-hydroxylase